MFEGVDTLQVACASPTAEKGNIETQAISVGDSLSITPVPAKDGGRAHVIIEWEVGITKPVHAQDRCLFCKLEGCCKTQGCRLRLSHNHSDARVQGGAPGDIVADAVMAVLLKVSGCYRRLGTGPMSMQW